MNSPKIECARVYRVGKIETVGTNGFQKRELALVINEETLYPDTIAVEASGAKCSLFDNLNVGDIVEVDVNLRGRIWKDKNGVEKIFNTLAAWKVVMVTKAPPVPTVADFEESDDPNLPF